MLIAIAGQSQNTMDNNNQKHGVWIENGREFQYHHGIRVGKIVDDYGYIVKDTTDKVIQRVEYFDKTSKLIRHEFKFQDDRSIDKYYGYDNAGKRILTQLDSLQEAVSPFNDRVYYIKEGLQIRYYFYRYNGQELGQRIEELYDDNILLKKTIYYPYSNNKYCEILCTTISSSMPTDHKSSFPGQEDFGVPSKVTYYYPNGNIMLTFDPAIFNQWGIDNLITNRSGGNLNFKLADFIPSLGNIGVWDCSAIQYVPDEDYFSGIPSRKQPLLDDSFELTVYNENGQTFKIFKYEKTQLDGHWKYIPATN